ncbi:AFR054Wp [Eremothecium gossypii ATCC 10895]|uniref:AFR054Wp n=1 Tax=Eremothecium gossypii (strain ATCC 10895 / CBS 109.51 / FGSC 9923 / NRRL Y-1056) TaxID=284811 RepID=Q754L8_EREGS|nr:AFR054Wp [Eremothecium gossypii ATCC 10895]AAS53425.2 AFR054Wp [Eremothecium gossypii ATCC 10895]AEY97737.1 FAFR054Wp [Eremothecium gossypii FDAG1]
MVELEIESELCALRREVALGVGWAQFAEKLHEWTGVDPRDMRLVVTTADGKEQEVDGDVRQRAGTVEQAFPGGVRRVQVQDTNEGSVVHALRREMEGDGGEEAAFRLSDEAYAGRADSVLAWKREQQLGAFDPEVRTRLAQERETQALAAAALPVGARCAVRTRGAPERRGWLRYVGPVDELGAENTWCGVEFDEPVGRNDGTFNGRAYFGPVHSNHGAFVKPTAVAVGPQFAPLADDELRLSDDDEL